MRKDFQNAFTEEFNIKIAILKVPVSSKPSNARQTCIDFQPAPEVQPGYEIMVVRVVSYTTSSGNQIKRFGVWWRNG